MKLPWPIASLRTYLVAMILLASVPMAVLMSLQIRGELRLQTERMNDGLLQVAGALGQAMSRELSATAGGLRLLAEPLADDPPRRFAERLANRSGAAAAQQLFLLDAGGRLVSPAATGPAPPAAARTGLAASSPPGSAALGEVAVSDLLRRPDGSFAIAVSVPVQAAGGGAYRLGAWVPAQQWQQLLQQTGLGDDSIYTLFDAQRRVIARTAGAERFVGQLLPASAIAAIGQRSSGVQRTEMLEGGAIYAAWRTVPGVAWGVGAGRPAGPIDLAHGQQALAAFATAAMCLLLGVTLALWMSRRITVPLRALGAGEAPPDQPVAMQELAALAQALAGSRRQQAAARQELQQRADEFETLFRISPVGLAFAQDADCGSVLFNDALKTLMHPARPAQGAGGPANSAWRIFHEGRPLEEPAQPLAVAARTGVPVPPTLLELRYGESEPLRFVMVQAVPLRDASGAPRGAIAAVVDVTEQRQLERRRAELVEREQAARRSAESANDAKNELLAMMGHELRNPLNAIVSANEVLKLLGGGGPKAHDARSIVERQARHMAKLLGDLLDMARVTAGQLRPESAPVDLGRLVAAHVAALRGDDDHLLHRLELVTQEVWVEGDAARLEQVLGQLMGNALRYTPAGGRIWVAVRAEAEHAVMEVCDEGPGIAPELLPRIFELFVQGERTLDREAGGLGVGLALVRRLVLLHGGSVVADSPGHGSRFTVRLPRIAAPAGSAAAEAPHRRARRVLLVEDNADALNGLCAALELDGHALSTATDGESGLAMLLAERPEVAVIDIGLPLLTGLEVARRSRGAGYAGRLIALSGYGLDTNARDALRAGFDAHLAKPVDFNRLRELLDNE